MEWELALKLNGFLEICVKSSYITHAVLRSRKASHEWSNICGEFEAFEHIDTKGDANEMYTWSTIKKTKTQQFVKFIYVLLILEAL